MKSLVSNSTHHSWHGKLPSFSSFGATVNSLIKILKKLAVSAKDCSTSDAITCSPKAEIKCLYLPVTKIFGGIKDVKTTVSPVLYAQRPALVETIIT